MQKIKITFGKKTEYQDLYNYLKNTFLMNPSYFEGYIDENQLPHAYCEVLFNTAKKGIQNLVTFNAFHGALEGQCVFDMFDENEKPVRTMFNFIDYNVGEKFYDNGSRYFGTFKNFVEDGFGAITFTNGNYIIGSWKDKVYHGLFHIYNKDGELTKMRIYKDGKIIYEGLDNKKVQEVLEKEDLYKLQNDLYEEANISRIIEIKDVLNKIENSIVGQKAAKELIVNNLLLSLLCEKQDNKPITSMLFTGPTGVGKTEMAKQIAKHLYNKDPFVVDFANFHDSFMISSLIGSPFGYIGSNDVPGFLKYIHDNEEEGGVILLDELDKADSDCYNLLMRMLDEGEVISAKNEVYSIKNFIIICTTNMSTNTTRTLGFSTDEKDELKQSLTKNSTGLKKEQLARFNVVAEFEKLTKNDNLNLIKKAIKETVDKLKTIAGYEIDIEYSKEVIEEILNKIDTDFGVRELNRQTTKLITDKLAGFIRKNESKNIKVTIKSLNDVQITDLTLKNNLPSLSKKTKTTKTNKKVDEETK